MAAREAGRGRAAAPRVLTGGRLTAEDAYAYAKFARIALGTNDIDFRARPHSAEEAEFLAAQSPAAGSVRRSPTSRRRRRCCWSGSSPRRRPRRLPAAAQGRPQARPAGLLGGVPLVPRPREARRPAAAVLAGQRGRRAGRPRRCRRARCGRRGGARSRVGDPRRRAAGDVARCAVGRRPAGRDHRREAGLDPAPGRRAWRARGRLPAEPAAGWPPVVRRHRSGRRAAAWGVDLPSARRP